MITGNLTIIWNNCLVTTTSQNLSFTVTLLKGQLSFTVQLSYLFKFCIARPPTIYSPIFHPVWLPVAVNERFYCIFVHLNMTWYALYVHENDRSCQGSHIVWLTNFSDFSSVFFSIIPVFFQCSEFWISLNEKSQTKALKIKPDNQKIKIV